jgi:hypothetical protein
MRDTSSVDKVSFVGIFVREIELELDRLTASARLLDHGARSNNLEHPSISDSTPRPSRKMNKFRYVLERECVFYVGFGGFPG